MKSAGENTGNGEVIEGGIYEGYSAQAVQTQPTYDSIWSIVNRTVSFVNLTQVNTGPAVST